MMKKSSWMGLLTVLTVFLMTSCGNLAKVKEENSTPVATIQAKVVDEFGAPIQGATVKILVQGVWWEGFVTDADGVFKIPNVPSSNSNYLVVIEATGYAKYESYIAVTLPSNFYPTGNQTVDLGMITLYPTNAAVKVCFEYLLPNSTVAQPAANASIYVTITYNNGSINAYLTLQADADGCVTISDLASSIVNIGDVRVKVQASIYVDYQGETIPFVESTGWINTLPNLTLDVGTITMNPDICIYGTAPRVVSFGNPVFDRCVGGGNNCDTTDSFDNTASGGDTKVVRVKVTFDQIMDQGTNINISNLDCGILDCGNTDFLRWDSDTQAVLEFWIQAGQDATGTDYTLTGARNYCGTLMQQYDGTF